MKLVDSQKFRSLARISINFDDTKSKYELSVAEPLSEPSKHFTSRAKYLLIKSLM
jgi:hypothetical protein